MEGKKKMEQKEKEKRQEKKKEGQYTVWSVHLEGNKWGAGRQRNNKSNLQ